MSQINAHSYSGSRRAELRSLATSKAKRLWQSESGPLNATLADDTEAALFMAGRIITDLRDMQPEAWVDWQIGDPEPQLGELRAQRHAPDVHVPEALLHAGGIQPLHPPGRDVRRREQPRHGRRRQRATAARWRWSCATATRPPARASPST